MKKFWAPFAVALTAALGVGTALPAAAATRTGPPSDAVRAVAAASAVRLMPLGDSITWGVGSPSGNGYRGFLWNQLAAAGHAPNFVGSGRGGTMSDPDNEGHSGWRIDQITGIADSVLARYRPNVVTLEIGTNDLNGNYQIPTAPDRLRALIDRITRSLPEVTVLVGTVIVSTSGTVEANRPGFNARIPGIVQAQQAAGKRVRLVDMSALTAADLADSLHPNDNGFRKMADAFNAGVRAADAAGWIKPPASTGAEVRSGTAGKCLDVNGGDSVNGTAADTRSCDGSDAQLRSARSDGTLRAPGKASARTAQVRRPNPDGSVTGVRSGVCLDAPGTATANGTLPQPSTCDGGSNQQRTRG